MEKKTNKLLLLWYAHPRIAIAMLLTVANLLVILLFTAILSIVSGNPFFDELGYLFTYTMCSDGIYDFVNQQEDVACFIIKIILTVIQMIIFSGALIGFATDILQNTFDKMLESKGKLYLKNHFVFLNWSSIGPNIIYDLSFLEGEKTIVILTEKEREEVINSIDSLFIENGRSKKGLRLFVKKGNPNSSKHLLDVSLSEAKYVGILLAEKEEDGAHSLSTKDLASFKLLMAILNTAKNANVVVEAENNNAVIRIEQFIKATHDDIKKRVSIFAHNTVTGYILGRAIVNPMYSHVYHHLLSFDGVEFYGIDPMNVEDALYTYNDCIPIVEYDDDDEIDGEGNKHTDHLYVLSEDSKSLGVRQEKKSFVKSIPYRENVVREDFTVFILSDSNRSEFVIEELDGYNQIYGVNVKYKIYSYNKDITEIIDEICATEGRKKILLLSDENADPDNQDADIFLSLLGLKSDKRVNGIDIFAEIVNPNNLTALENLGIASVIVSNKIVSLFLVQLLTHAGSKKFYRDILVSPTEKENGIINFDILKVKELFDLPNGFIEFSCYSEVVQSIYKASGNKKTVIGYKKAGDCPKNIEYFCTGMDIERKIKLCDEDELIVISIKN